MEEERCAVTPVASTPRLAAGTGVISASGTPCRHRRYRLLQQRRKEVLDLRTR